VTADGHLECVYHGWQYGANGRCVRIPSVSSRSNMSSLICARTLPVHEQYGFIWVWPGKRELAHAELVPHRLFDDVQNADGRFLLSPEYCCQLDIPYDLMMDNLLDLAHIDFTHDGTIGKRSQASCLRSERIHPSPFFSTNSESTSFNITRHEQPTVPSPIARSTFHFIPPCFIRIEHQFVNSARLFVQVFIVLPSAQTKMRLLLQFYRNFARFKWLECIPTYDFWTDRMNKRIVDQDVLLLAGIHRNISEMGAKPLATTVSADAPIKAFRRYQSRALAKYGRIHVEQGAWTNKKKCSSTESPDMDEHGPEDIEDIKID
jgi:phenylpropionate dioxygenase-like ring-hydroxylating dioxygenase large terminal subunit